MATLTTTINYSEPAGSIIASLGTPGPAGPGVPPGGSANQILAKIDGVSYNTEWVNPQDIAAVWGQITGNIANQSDLQSALDAKLDSSTAASTYLPLAGGIITGDIQSNNGSGYRAYDGALNTSVLTPAYLQFNKSGIPGGALTVEWDGITFATGKQTVAYPGTVILDGYATESWVNLQLGSYLTISSASATYYPLTNPAGYITLSALAGYATESWVTGQGYLTASDAAATYYPLTNPSGFIADAPADGTTYGRKDGAWSAVVSSVAWGSITGDLANQYDLQGALDAKYDASNPAGFITSAALAGYATESWVSSQGYLTSGDLSGYATESWVSSQDYLQSSTAATTYQTLAGMVNYAALGGASFTGLVLTKASNGAGAGFRIPIGTAPSSPVLGDIWNSGSALTVRFGASTETIANQSWVTSQGYITSSALTPYALLSGATFTGKINAAASNAGSAGLNLGAGTAPTSPLPGDVWTAANTDTLRYRAPLTNQTFDVAVRNATNTFSSPNIIDTTATTAALRVTQKGTGNAIEIEDSTTPDATRFVVDQFGKVGIGVAPDATAAIKIDGNGMSFNGLVFNPTATAAHTGGTDTLDLLVTINGTAYRIGLRPA